MPFPDWADVLCPAIAVQSTAGRRFVHSVACS